MMDKAMLNRRLFHLLIFLAAFLLLGTTRTAAAQDQHVNYALAVPKPSLSTIKERILPSFTPVDIRKLDTPAVLAAGEPGVFTAVANIESATLPLQVEWDFGDGSTASSLHARHTYQEPGTYVVTFRLKNKGSEDHLTAIVRVVPRQEKQTGESKPA